MFLLRERCKKKGEFSPSFLNLSLMFAKQLNNALNLHYVYHQNTGVIRAIFHKCPYILYMGAPVFWDLGTLPSPSNANITITNGIAA